MGSSSHSRTEQVQTVEINGRIVTRTFTKGEDSFTVTDESPEGRMTTTVLDKQGRPVQQQVGNLEETEYSYDNQGRLDGISQGGRTTTMSYDADGNVETVTDPEDRTVSFTYDAAGRVTRQTLPDSRTTDFTYDARGNLRTITPPGHNPNSIPDIHFFTYLPKGQPQYYWPPTLGGQHGDWRTQYKYNFSGLLTHVIRPDGEYIFHDYDLLSGQVSALVPSIGDYISYAYSNETGNLTTATTESGQQCAYTYDGPLPKSETWDGAVDGSVSRSFDNSFRVSSQSVNGGNTVSFGYDDDDLLTSAGSLSIDRDTNGLIEDTTISNAVDAYGYNGFGEVTSYSATVNSIALYSVSYSRDALGRITAKSETVQGTTDSYTYTYDTAGRLTDVSKNSSLSGHYNYDSNGNRIPDSSPPTFNQFAEFSSTTYDAQDRLTHLELQSGIEVQYSYTDNGELLTKTVDDEVDTQETTYSYDLFGNLKQVVLPSPTPSATPTTIDYLVDGNNRRIGKKMNGTQVQGFLYDGQLNVVAELDGSNNLVSRFVYATKSNVPDYTTHHGGHF